jgi:hypothetical protein
MTTPTSKSLLAEIDSLQISIRDSRRKARALADDIETYEVVRAGPEAIAKEMARLQRMIHTVEATRDQWATTCRELRREVWALGHRLGAKA